MKKFFLPLIVLVLCFVVWTTQVFSQESLKENEIYVFTQKTCRHCLAAEAYLKEKHPDLEVQLKDISNHENRDLFFTCGRKFNLKKNEMGTPLFCMGKNYIMGWSYDEQKKFEEYVKDFLK